MFFAGQRYGTPCEVCTCMAREVAGRRQSWQWFGCTSPAHWAALAPTRFVLHALDECAKPVRARRWLLCGRETRVVRRADSAERLSAAEQRPNKTFGPWGTGRTENATDVETKVLHG